VALGVNDVSGRVDGALRGLRAAFGSRLRAVALFGSYARGEATERSDVDLAVVLSDRLADDWATVAFAVNPDIDTSRPRVSVVLWSDAELRAHPWLLIDVSTDGVVLEDDGSLAREMAAVQARLRAYGSRRVRLEDGTWYWDLKPDWVPGDDVVL
jgi:predicted nucleotidyltransferase